MTTHHQVAGVGLAVVGESPAAQAARSRLQDLPACPDVKQTLNVVFRAGVAPRSRAGASAARIVYDPPVGEVLYSDAHDLLVIETANGVSAACHPGFGEATIWTGDGGPEARRLASHAVFTLCLVELLRERRSFNLHAAALSRAGLGLLIAGSSGAGKSTLTTALLRAGLCFLGDDTCFLARTEAGIVVLPFPDVIDLTETTIGFFPELAPLLRDPVPAGSPKRQLRPRSIYDSVTYEAACSPVVIVFPARAPGGSSWIEPVTSAEALLELAPNVLLTAPARAHDHFAVLGELVRSCRCYRLFAATDFERIAGLLGQLLPQAARVAS